MSEADQIRAVVTALEANGHPFEAVQETTWVATVEGRFGQQLPAAFRLLVTQFAFPEFEVGGVAVFSNLNDGSASDITVAPFADAALSRWLIEHKFIQFGRPETGSYDPVCFDVSEKQEAPVVLVDHEDILLGRKKVRVQRLAQSFLGLVEAALHNNALKSDARETRAP